MRVVFALTVACFSLAGAGPAAAADIEAASKIDAVTVYPDAAAITRVADVDLTGGAVTLVFKGLPLGIDPASLRVAAESGGQLTIGSVETRVAPIEADRIANGLDARLRVLRADRETLQVALDALEGKKAMILRFSQAAPEKISLDAKPIDIGQWDAAWDKVGAALAKVGDELRDARVKARALDDEIKGLEASRQRPAPETGPARDVTVALASDGATKAKVFLTYRVADAGWRPLYDARLETGSQSKRPALELVRRAAIVQRTGEDWADASLTVSTVRTDRGTAAPDMEPMRIAFAEPSEPEAASGGLRFKKSAMVPAPGLPHRAPAAASLEVPAPPPKPAAEEHSTLDAGPYEASFRVPGRLSVPSDGTQKSFLLGSQSLSPTLAVKTVPALEQTAYLDAHVSNDGGAPLLPGEVALLRDGSYVGTGRIGLVAPGDALDLGFGADDRVKVTRVPVKRKENDPYWVGTNKTEADEFKTTVKNLHEFPIRVSIVDQIPISETTTIVVEQLPGTTPPTEKTIADKRGVMGWSFDLQPNEIKEIHLAYRMKWPADREVVFEEAPVAPH